MYSKNNNIDKVNDDGNENSAAGNYRLNNNNATTSESLEYKAKIMEGIPDNYSRLDVEIVAPLKCLSNVWRFFDLPLISCKIELDFSWEENL